MDRFKIINKNELEKLPKTTGVYVFFEKNSKFEIRNSKLKCIYIGKAMNIRNRVKNHFNPAQNASHIMAGKAAFKDNILSEKTTRIGFFETGSEIEALILEANLIKKYQPKYNVMWRDDKNYFYVAIAQNKNKIPYVFITHQPKNFKFQISNFKFELVGPFVEGTALKKTLRFLRRVFPYYTTKKHSKNKCAYCHLDLCPGPVRNSSLASEISNGAGPYLNLIDYKKNIKKLILILRGKRKTVLHALLKEMRAASQNQNFEKAGKLRDKILALRQIMAHTHVISGSMPSGSMPGLDPKISLENILGINKNIHRIECYDISNIQGKQATGSMVVFSAQGGPASGWKPDKNQYRKFRIKMKNEPNDIAMLKEVLQRRFAHPEWPFPDAILIDGGKAQLNIAIKTKNEIEKETLTLSPRSYSQGHKIKNTKIISIAKGKQELFIEGKKKPIPLKSLPQGTYNLIKQLDDEAHRFAIAYHKTLRKKFILH